MSLAESQEFFALNPDDLSGLAEMDRSGGSIWPTQGDSKGTLRGIALKIPTSAENGPFC